MAGNQQVAGAMPNQPSRSGQPDAVVQGHPAIQRTATMPLEPTPTISEAPLQHSLSGPILLSSQGKQRSPDANTSVKQFRVQVPAFQSTTDSASGSDAIEPKKEGPTQPYDEKDMESVAVEEVELVGDDTLVPSTTSPQEAVQTDKTEPQLREAGNELIDDVKKYRVLYDFDSSGSTELSVKVNNNFQVDRLTCPFFHLLLN